MFDSLCSSIRTYLCKKQFWFTAKVTLLIQEIKMTLIFDEFKLGMGMEAEFTIPDSGKSSILLVKDVNNYMIHVSPKWDRKVLVISTKTDGEYGNEQTIDDFDHESGGTMTVRIEAQQSYYAVFVNNNLISKYPGLQMSDIKKARFFGEEGSLTKLSALYQPAS